MGSGAGLSVRRRGSSAALVLVLLLGLSGCGIGADRSPTLEAGNVAQKLEIATGIPLKAVPPPAGAPGLPELATTLSGSTRDQSLTVFVFFETPGAKRVLGSGSRPAGMNVMTRSNVVVLYRASARAAVRARQVREALEAVIASA